MPSRHLHHAGRPEAEQRAALEGIVLATPALMAVLKHLRALALPDPLIGGGAIYNTVWNRLTGRPDWTGIKDIDVLYFDDSDLSWEAEDRVIAEMERACSDAPVPVEVRNQARVHLWYPDRFGITVPPLTSSAQALERYAATTHAVAVRLNADESLHVEAPFGFDPLFSFRMVPNPVLDSRKSFTVKAARAKSIWPEVEVVPWPA